jgi:hypothetical protein
MAYKLSNTDKWSDFWFSQLKPIEKLLFIYLCDNCDIAGFIEINYRKWASDIDTSVKVIEEATTGLRRGVVYSKENDCLYLRNHLKHQKHFPLNEKDSVYKPIVKRFELYSYKFDIVDIDEFIIRGVNGEGTSPQPPKGKGKGKDNGIGIIKTWRNNFEIYQSELKVEFDKLLNDFEYLKDRQNYHPKLDIKLSLQKSYHDFWNKESGWKNKKASKSEILDWKSTFNNALSMKPNQVWLQDEKKSMDTKTILTNLLK